MFGDDVELQRLDMREWSGLGEPGYVGNRCPGPGVDEDLVAMQNAFSSTVERDLQGFVANEAAFPHYDLRLAPGKVFHVHQVKTIYHLPLARPYARHGNSPLI